VSEARDARLALLFELGDDLGESLVLWGEEKWLRQIDPCRVRLGAEARDDVGEVNRDSAEPPRARIEAVRIVDMSSSNAWAEFSSIFRRTREAYLEHENAKAELKALTPVDAKEATGHGIRAKRSKSGAVTIDVLDLEGSHAPVQ